MKPKIYFLGSGDIAVPVLEKLVQNTDFQVLGVITQPDRPCGRGSKLAPTPVGAAAAAMESMPLFKTDQVNSPEILQILREAEPDFLVVVSFGQILKADLLTLPRYSCLNVHASLLPRYRGASPIIQSILHRENATGIAFMQMEKGLDTGPVYQMVTYPLNGTETAPALELALGKTAAEHLPDVLLKIASGEMQCVPQDHAAATCCGKIRREHGKINWGASAAEIEAMARAYAPWPGAYFTAHTPDKDVVITILKAKVREDLSGAPGTVLEASKRGLIIACGENALELLTISVPGKREMAATAFLNGLRGAAITLDAPEQPSPLP